MKKACVSVMIALSLFFFSACGDGSSTEDESTYDPSLTGNTIYKQRMRTFVQNISAWARVIKPGFIVIPQNGHELLTIEGSPTGTPAADYLGAINGVGREDLFYGYNADNQATPAVTGTRSSSIWMLPKPTAFRS